MHYLAVICLLLVIGWIAFLVYRSYRVCFHHDILHETLHPEDSAVYSPV
jgi:hypothetical protein